MLYSQYSIVLVVNVRCNLSLQKKGSERREFHSAKPHSSHTTSTVRRTTRGTQASRQARARAIHVASHSSPPPNATANAAPRPRHAPNSQWLPYSPPHPRRQQQRRRERARCASWPPSVPARAQHRRDSRPADRARFRSRDAARVRSRPRRRGPAASPPRRQVCFPPCLRALDSARAWKRERGGAWPLRFSLPGGPPGRPLLRGGVGDAEQSGRMKTLILWAAGRAGEEVYEGS